MPVEFIGIIFDMNDGSESRPQTTPPPDPDFTRLEPQAHEDAGFDRVLIRLRLILARGHPGRRARRGAQERNSACPIAHRPGFVFPTLAVRWQFATLDHFSGGRVAVHVITGGNDAEQRRDGDYLGKDERHPGPYADPQPSASRGSRRRRSASTAASTASRATTPGCGRFRPAGTPLFFGGSSAAAYQVGGKDAGHVRAVG